MSSATELSGINDVAAGGASSDSAGAGAGAGAGVTAGAGSGTDASAADRRAGQAGAGDIVTTGEGDFLTIVSVTSERLDVGALSVMATCPGTGATCSFAGTTRDTFDGKTVTRLEYEAYVPMAVSELQKLCADARTKWPHLRKIVIYHRLGVVPVLEPSVVICVSSPHRPDALAALPFLIDTLKERVPIWKKEWYADDTGAWKENKEAHLCCQHGAKPSTLSE